MSGQTSADSSVSPDVESEPLHFALGTPLTIDRSCLATQPHGPIPSSTSASRIRCALMLVAKRQRSVFCSRTNSAHDENGTRPLIFELISVIVSAWLRLLPIACAIS